MTIKGIKSETREFARIRSRAIRDWRTSELRCRCTSMPLKYH